MRLNQLVFWGLLLEQAISQSKSANLSGTITESPVLKRVILLDDNEEQEQCTLKYLEFKNSYLQFVNRPNYKDYITSYEGCFEKCCFESSFCKSFSYFPGTDQCFLMNVTRHDEGVVMAYSVIHMHVEMVNPDHTATTDADDSSLYFTATSNEVTETDSGDGSYPAIIATTVPTDIEINPTSATGSLKNKTHTSAQTFANQITNKSSEPRTNFTKTDDTNYPYNSIVTTPSVWKFAQDNTTSRDETQSGDGKRKPSDDSADNDATSNELTADVAQIDPTSKPRQSSNAGDASVMTPKFTTTKPQLQTIESPKIPKISPTESTLKEQSSTVRSFSSKSAQPKLIATTASSRTLSQYRHQSSPVVIRSEERTISSTSSTIQHKSTLSLPADSTSASSTSLSPSVELQDSITLRSTTLRYSPTLSRLTTSRTRPPGTKRTSSTTQQQVKTKSKSVSNGRVLKVDEKTNLQTNHERGLMNKLTSCAFECKNGGKCIIYGNIKTTRKCRCKVGFEGKFCEKVTVASKEDIFRITWWIILLIVVAIILFICVVVTFLIFYIYKRKVGNYNLKKERKFELASAYSPDRIDQALGPHYASLAWQNRPAQSVRSTDDANKSWIFCYFDNETRCESIYRMRAST